MCHQHPPGALVELQQIGKTASGADGVLHDPPEAFDGVEVVPTMGREAMAAKRIVVVVESGVELVRPVDPAAIDDHHDLCAGCAEGRHDLVQILPQLLGIQGRHNFREDVGGAILDRPQDAEQSTAGAPAPGAIASPRLAFAGFVAVDLPLAQRAYGEAHARGGAPPAGAGQGKAPEDRFVCIEQNELAPTRLVLEGRKCERAIREVCGVGSEATSGTIGAYVLFFKTPRTLSRPSWMPVCWASAGARSRQLHCAWMEPGWRGS
jgi:hypothetical protein